VRSFAELFRLAQQNPVYWQALATLWKDETDRLRGQVQRLRDAAELPLMFHAGGIWLGDNPTRWKQITGTDEATTKVMCDHIRSVLAQTTLEEPR